MSLSEDKRELCPLHGWVGRRAFQQDRHDLCAAPREPSSSDEGDEDPQAEETDADSEDSATVEPALEEPRWSRAAARRQGIPPKKTLAVRRITQLELATGRTELQALGANAPYDRPKTRRDCQWCPACQLVRDGKSNGHDRAAFQALGRDPIDRNDPSSSDNHLACGHRSAEVIWHSRPCVFVACSKTLYLDVSDTGSIILNFPHLEPGQMPPDRSCALDLAERGAMTLEDIAVVTNLTRERIRQVELKALTLRARPAAIEMGLGPDDAADLGTRPGADLEETGIEGSIPSDIAATPTGRGSGDDG